MATRKLFTKARIRTQIQRKERCQRCKEEEKWRARKTFNSFFLDVHDRSLVKQIDELGAPTGTKLEISGTEYCTFHQRTAAAIRLFRQVETAGRAVKVKEGLQCSSTTSGVILDMFRLRSWFVLKTSICWL